MSKKTAKILRLSQAGRFLRVSRLLLWTIWVIYRERRRVIRAHEKGNYEAQPNAAFFLHDHNQILAFAALGLAGFLGLRLFFRW